jgi:hypothetical protein
MQRYTRIHSHYHPPTNNNNMMITSSSHHRYDQSKCHSP